MVLLGANQRDTIDSQLAQPLRVEVRNRLGKPSAATRVHFNVVPDDDTTQPERHLLLMCESGDSNCGARTGGADVITTSSGRATVRMRLRTIAGQVFVRVTVDELALADSISVQVLPGRLVGLRAGVRDSSVYVGNSYSLRPDVIDRAGNAGNPRPVSYEVSGAAVRVEAGMVHGQQIGRSQITLRSGVWADTAWVTVPPRGRLAAYFDRPFLGHGLATMELDGSSFRPLVTTAGSYYGIHPGWSPQGDAIVYEHGNYLFVTDTVGNTTRLTPPSTPTTTEVHGTYARNGTIYFAAAGSTQDYGTGIWRSSGVGASPTRVGPNPTNNANAWQPSVAPDGARLVFHSVNAPGPAWMDITTGRPTYLGAVGQMPRWSPSDDWILYSGASEWIYLNRPQNLHMVRADGNGRRMVFPTHQFLGRPEWSPDAKWVVASALPAGQDPWLVPALLAVANVATGEVLPLPWSSGISQPSWRP
jgi:hypothetical protein